MLYREHKYDIRHTYTIGFLLSLLKDNHKIDQRGSNDNQIYFIPNDP